jgi:hypothetical protein
MAHEAGKGDAQRPTDHQKYSDNYDKIFRKNAAVKPEQAELEIAEELLKNPEIRQWILQGTKE